MSYLAPWVPTRSGGKVCLAEPQPAMIEIEDIACALSRLPRFNGHTTEPYSVAQHSVLVSIYLRHEAPPIPLAALLHDGHEAYFGDITTPVKDLLASQFLQAKTSRMDGAIAERFGIDVGLLHCQTVKDADRVLLATEKRDLMPLHATIWHCPSEPWSGMKIVPWSTEESEQRFLERFRELTKKEVDHAD
jgi:hypothetical protein